MKILIFQPRLLGDIIVGTAAAEQLKIKYPNSELTYITSCKILTETNPFIDRSIERHIHRRFEKYYFEFIKKFYDKAFFVLHWLPRKNMFQDLMASAGVERKNYPLKLFLKKSDLEKAHLYVQQKIISHKRKLIAVQDDFELKWNEQEFLKLKKLLEEKYNIIYIGKNMTLNNKNLNMRESAAVISLCDLFVGGISGNMHAAVAVGTTTMCTSSVFNPEWDMPEYYQNEFIKDDKKKHITIRPKNENFCGDFKCVSLSEKAVIVSNSERQFGYATKICPAGLPQSCIHSIRAEDIFLRIQDYFN